MKTQEWRVISLFPLSLRLFSQLLFLCKIIRWKDKNIISEKREGYWFTIITGINPINGESIVKNGQHTARYIIRNVPALKLQSAEYCSNAMYINEISVA